MQTAVWVAVCLSMIGLARAADVTNVARKRIQLGPQELGAALQKFGELEGLHIVFLSEDVQNRHTSGVSGSLTYAEALEQLLRGTDLTYRFLETLTVMILPASGMPGAPVEPKSASGSEDDARKGIVASIDAGTPARQVTITAARQSDAQQLEYFRLLSAMSRSEYKRLVKTLPFVDVGTVHFPGGKGPEGRLPLGQHIQAGGVDGLVVWRVSI